MTFSMDEWREKIREQFTDIQSRAEGSYRSSLYGLLAASSLLPVLEAMRVDPWAGGMAFGTVVSSVSTNLLANLVQKWRDTTDLEQLAGEIDNEMADKPQLRTELAHLLENLNTINIAKDYLDIEKISAHLDGSGAIIQGDGNQGAGKRGIAANSVENSLLQTGDTTNQIENQIYHLYFQQIPTSQPTIVSSEKKYLEKLRRSCLALPLTAMGSDAGTMNEISLDKIYISMDTETRIPLTDKEKVEQKGRVRGRELDDKPLPIFDAARESQRLVVLGDPGGGKSTFVKQLAAVLAKCRRNGDKLERWGAPELPVMLELRNLVPKLALLNLDGKSAKEADAVLVQTVFSQFKENLEGLGVPEFMAELEQKLENMPLLLVFDGLDEVPENIRSLVRQAILAIVSKNEMNSRVIVTCRSRSYTAQAELHGFAVHKLAPLSTDKIKSFIKAWYNAQIDSIGHLKAADHIEKLQQAVSSDDLKKLAANPMLLTTMTIIHQKNVGLPKERVKLFSMAVTLLLRNWQMHRSGSIPVSPELNEIIKDEKELRRIVENLAYCIHTLQSGGKCEVLDTQGDTVAVVERGALFVELEKEHNFGKSSLAIEFLDYIDHCAGLVVGHGGVSHAAQQYSFPHRIFQEYLVGCRMVRERDAARVFEENADEGDFWHIAAKLGAEEMRYNYSSLHHVFDLAEALSSRNGGDECVHHRAVLWSGHMAKIMGVESILTDSSGKGREYLDRLKSQLVAIMRKPVLGAAERAEAGRILAKIGDPRDEVMVPEKFVLLPVKGGKFHMGEGEESFEYAVADFLMAQFPVTNAQFHIFIDDGGYAERSFWEEAIAHGVWDNGMVQRFSDEVLHSKPFKYEEPFNLPNHPVVGVCWYEALAYCRWLTARLQGLGIILTNREIRLPYETEWEKAARDGGQHSFPWQGDFDSDRCNVVETQLGTTNCVGCFETGKSPFGVEEMVGNVWEWTASVYGEYPYPPNGKALEQRQLLAAGKNARRVIRGGAHSVEEGSSRCSSRSWYDPLDWKRFMGFRVVCAPLTSDPLSEVV